MAINARAAARREAEKAFLREENKRLEDLGNKRKKAAEESAAKEEKKVPWYIEKDEKLLEELDVKEFLEESMELSNRIDSEKEPGFFGEEDVERETKNYLDFGREFLKNYREQTAAERAKENKEKDLIGAKDAEKLSGEKYVSPMVRGNMQRSENMHNAYKAGEEWLMSEGDDDLVKAFINNFRSAIGTGVEDLAYWISDNAPWYTPARKVVENNIAGEIADTAQRQFGNAKANGVNGKFVDAMDSLSKGLGYSAFGFKAGNYIADGSDAFGEYRNLRDSGYLKEEATLIMAKKAPMYILSNKADDYLGKSGKVDDVLYGKNGIVAKADDVLPDASKKSTITERIEKGEISTKLDKWKQNKHIEGTNEFKTYKSGRNGGGHTDQSILTIENKQVQTLINKFSGKGEPKKVKNNTNVNVEYAEADFVIGKYYSNGKYYDTKRFAIHYSKDGAHIVPVAPLEE